MKSVCNIVKSFVSRIYQLAVIVLQHTPEEQRMIRDYCLSAQWEYTQLFEPGFAQVINRALVNNVLEQNFFPFLLTFLWKKIDHL